MPKVVGKDRYQVQFVALDDLVGDESDVRLIDAFVAGLDLAKLEFGEPKAKGRPSYGADRLLKLLVYGYRKGVRSSRKLAEACCTNVEVMWLTEGVAPDFRTISDFRKDNVDKLKKVFKAFNDRLSGKVEWGFSSVDGSKFRANNSKMANFTASKLDDRVAWGNGHIDEYLRQIEEIDSMEEADDETKITKELLEAKIAELRKRMDKYEGLKKEMEEFGESQVSTTDPDARLMKEKNGFTVAYNPQTAVDSNTHLIRDFEMTNAPTDHGQLLPTMGGIAEEADGIAEVTADMGYQSTDDMVACLENGVLPHVICGDGKDGHDIETSYAEADPAELRPESTDPDELGKCIHAGVVPEAYAHAIEGMEVVETKKKVVDEPDRQDPREYGTRDEMVARAKEGYFVRDPEDNVVVCPNGESLRQRSVRKNGTIVYSNKTACRRCPFRNKCFRGKQDFKEIGFTKDQLEKPNKVWHEAEGTEPDSCGVTKGKYHYERRRVVRFRIRPQLSKTTKRMQLSEHPFGTIKRDMGMDYFLLRGLQKVEGEFSLMALGYNIARAKNMFPFAELLEMMAA